MATVDVYTTPTCQWCKKVKAFLKANKVAFKEHDATNEKVAKELVEKSGQMGVPVTIVGKEIIVGFDEGKLKKALKLK